MHCVRGIVCFNHHQAIINNNFEIHNPPLIICHVCLFNFLLFIFILFASCYFPNLTLVVYIMKPKNIFMKYFLSILLQKIYNIVK